MRYLLIVLKNTKSSAIKWVWRVFLNLKVFQNDISLLITYGPTAKPIRTIYLLTYIIIMFFLLKILANKDKR